MIRSGGGCGLQAAALVLDGRDLPSVRRWRGLFAWLGMVAALLIGLVAPPAQAATYPCSVGPTDIVTLHFTNAGDGSYQAIGLTSQAISATSGLCNALTSTTAIRPYLNDGMGRSTVGGTYLNATVQGGGLQRFATNEVRYRPPSASFSGTDTFTIDNNNIARLIQVTVIVDTSSASTTTSVASSLNPSTFGQSVTFTATITTSGTPTGTVTFKDGATTLGTGTVSGGAATYTTSALTAGPHTITAVYGGDSGHGTSTSSVLAQVVNAAVSAPVASSFTASAVAYNTGAALPTTIDLSGHATNTPTNYAVGSATTANGGTVSVTAAGLATYTPPAGFRGNDSFTFTATNTGGTSSAATVTVPVSNPALTIGLSATTGVAGIALASTNVTVSGGKAPYSCTLASSAPPAGVTLGSNCSLTGTPTAAGAASFTVTVSDSSTGTGPFSQTSGTLSLTIGQASTTTALVSSVNPSLSGASVTFTATVVGVVPTGTVTFKDGATTIGSGTVSGGIATYTTSALSVTSHTITAFYGGDANNAASTSSAIVQVVTNPPAPVALAASASVVFNTAKAIDLSASITGVHTGIAVATGPAHGTTSVSGDVVTYTPTTGYFGADAFTYTAAGPGGTSVAATVTIVVAAPGAPVALAASASVVFNTAKAIDLSASITGVHTSIAVATGPAHGTTSVSGDVITYTPTTGYFGADAFTYTATGPGGTSVAATVAIVVATPAAPVALAASASVVFNTAKAIDLSASITGVHTSIAVATGPAHGTTSVVGDVVTYTPTTGYFGADAFTYTATGPGGTSVAATVAIVVATPAAPVALAASASVVFNTAKAIDLSASITGVHTSIAVATGPAHGTTSVVGDVVTYTPTTGYFGADAFTYTATGPGGTSVAATVAIVVATPGAPVALAASASVAFNTAKAIDLSASITGAHTSIAVATGPAHGTTSVVGDVVTYTPTTGYFGADAFTYTATGPGGTSVAATVAIVVATPAAPVALAASASVVFNTAKAIDLSASITGVHTSIAVATGPAHGTTSVVGDVITYTPTTGYFGADAFTYTATGPGGTSVAATVAIVVATPAAPVALAASASVVFNTAKAIDLSASITGVHTSIAVATGPAHGTTSVVGDVVTYTPTTGYFGADAFTYTATGPGGTSVAATVTIVVATPGAPVALAASASVAFNTAKAIDLSASITGVHTSIAVATGPAHGTTSVSGSVVTYTPTAGYFGADAFTYTATGPGGTSVAATVTLTVATPAAPSVAAASASVSYDTAKAIDLSGSITGVHTSVAVATGPAHGTTSVSGDVVTYTPTTGYFGADSFTYTATGPGGTSSAATVTLTVATPAAPIAAAASASVNYNTAKAIDLSASVTGVHTSIAVASGPAHGTTSVSGNVVTYTPTAGYFGADSFTYTATGPGGTSSAATVTLTIATPAAPTASAASASVSYDTAKAIDLSGSIGGVHTSIAVASGPAHGTTSVSGDVVRPIRRPPATLVPTASSLGFYTSDRPRRDVVGGHGHVNGCDPCRAHCGGRLGERELQYRQGNRSFGFDYAVFTPASRWRAAQRMARPACRAMW
jgi:hypothetical protein